MRKKIVFNLIPFILLLLIFQMFSISPNSIKNYTDIMSGVLSFASMGSGFLITAFSLLPIFSDSKLVIKMKELGTDLKLMDSLLNASVFLFLSSLLSLLGLLLSHQDRSLFSILFISVWGATLVLTLLKTVQVLFYLMLTFKTLYKEDID